MVKLTVVDIGTLFVPMPQHTIISLTVQGPVDPDPNDSQTEGVDILVIYYNCNGFLDEGPPPVYIRIHEKGDNPC